MAKYTASPWGDILGKLGDTVGGKWKGIYWARKRVNPAQRGTLALYHLLKRGAMRPYRFSFKQMNIRRLVFQILGWLARTNMENMIIPIWEQLCTRRALQLTGGNLFLKRSAALLWASIPDQDQEFNASTNSPDMKELYVSDGDLEGTPILTAVYVPATGFLTLTFSKTIYQNGDDTDYAQAMCYIKPLMNGETWRPNGYMYGKAQQPDLPAPSENRVAESIVLHLPLNLDPTKMTAFLFFRDEANAIGFSPSSSLDVS